MERLDLKQIREIIYRLRQGQSERQIARDTGISRVTVHKYYTMALSQGYMDRDDELPTDRELVERLGPWVSPPWTDSPITPRPWSSEEEATARSAEERRWKAEGARPKSMGWMARPRALPTDSWKRGELNS